jgi:peroxiredoxin
MDPIAAVVGKPAPDFVLQDLDGTSFRLAEQRGRILVLSFWSADCPHSERADGILTALSVEWGDSVGVWWVASNDNEDEERLRRMSLQRHIGPVLRDPGQAVADRYAAQVTPQLFVIDERGLLRYAGAPDDVSFRQRVPTRNYLADAVQALLHGRAPDPDSTAPYGCAIMRRPTSARPTTRL